MYKLLALLLNAVAYIKPGYEFLINTKDVYNNYQQKKTELFVERVFRNTKDATIHDVHKNDILHNFYMTLDCIQKVRKQEQVEHFAEILQTYLQDDRLQLPDYDDKIHDNYELVLNMLTGLSYIEFELLVMLYKYEKPYHDQSTKVKSIEYWDKKFMPEAQEKLSLESTVILGLFQILHAKGMFYLDGSTGLGDHEVIIGTLSKLFVMIVSYLPSIK